MKINLSFAIFAVSSLACHLPAHAAEVAFTVTADGRPLSGAVVTFSPSVMPPGPIRFAQDYRIDQKQVTFVPHVLIVPVSATVGFANLDRVRHHVFSFSLAKRFELKLFGQEQERPVHFNKPGVVSIGCNIHDRMSAFIVVVDTPFAKQTDTAGVARWTGVAPGAGIVHVWHPLLRAPGNHVEMAIRVAATGVNATAIPVELRNGSPG